MTSLKVEFQKLQEYDCMAEKGKDQIEWLKAIGFSDHWTENLFVFNVCRAKLPGEGGTCGFCLPSKLWEQPDPERWRFVCGADWEKLIQASEQFPDDIKLSQWVSNLAEEYGSDPKKVATPAHTSDVVQSSCHGPGEPLSVCNFVLTRQLLGNL